jgi:hypothetical protein
MHVTAPFAVRQLHGYLSIVLVLNLSFLVQKKKDQRLFASQVVSIKIWYSLIDKGASKLLGFIGSQLGMDFLGSSLLQEEDMLCVFTILSKPRINTTRQAKVY